MSPGLMAGASEVNITPVTRQFLYGYPHVKRYSDGIDTPLFSTSLYLDDGFRRVLFIANDLIFLSRATVQEIRKGISQRADIAPEHILVTCTHTHSGPVTIHRIGCEEDPVVPDPDPEYLDWCVKRMISGAVAACSHAQPCEIGFSAADATGVGTNRRDPNGPRNPHVPVVLVRNREDHHAIAIMLACSMHPTVLHEDSTNISADFPGYCRACLKHTIADCPVLYHTSPAGNQSPRHVTRENTPAEAKRIGEILGSAVLNSVSRLEYRETITVDSRSDTVEFPLNSFPEPEEAEELVRRARQFMEQLQHDGASPKQIRTAECDWFGAEKRWLLSRLDASNELAREAAKVMPAEVQVVRIGSWRFVAWPGEVFVEYCLAIMSAFDNTFVLAYANGEVQGYLVTQEAAEEGGYEAATAVFKSPESPLLLVELSRKLLREMD